MKYNDNKSNEELIREYRKTGDKEIKNEIKKKNIPFVKKRAANFEKKIRNYLEKSITYDDLVNVGTLGLGRAIEKYDEKYGVKFLSYAGWWVNQEIYKEIHSNASTVREPMHIHERRRKARKLIRLGYEQEEIAKILSIDKKELAGIINYQQFVSLDQELNGNNNNGDHGNENDFYDIMKDERVDIHSDYETKELKRLLEEMIKILDSRERYIITHRYLYAEKTLEDIGEDFNLSRERIRQIEEVALRKLRHVSKSKKLREFYDSPQL